MTRAHVCDRPYGKAGQRATETQRDVGTEREGERQPFIQKSENLQDADIHKQLALFTKAGSRTNANHTPGTDTRPSKLEHVCLC